jgi:putative FmdB family regulatory protein
MPLYEYNCDKCNKTIEVLVMKKEDEPVNCACGGVLSKLISKCSFKFNCLGSSKDYKHREEQAQRRAGTYSKGAKLD